MIKKLSYILLFLSSSVIADSQLELFACDPCNNDRMRQIAQMKAPLLQCTGGINPDTGMADIDFWDNNAVCTAAVKELIVANPYTRIAFKYRVQGPNPQTNQPASIAQLNFNSEEQEMVEAYFDIANSIKDAVYALDEPAAAANRFNQVTTMTTSSTSAAPSTDCLNSAAAHLFSSNENKTRLTNTMRHAIKTEVGKRTWRDFTSSLETTGTSSTGGLTVTAGVAAGVSGSASVTVNQEFIQSDIVFVAAGGETCGMFGLFCNGPDYNNLIVYSVNYHGNIVTNGINDVFLTLSLHPTLSRVEGKTVGEMLELGRANITNNPNSCLSELIDSITPGSENFVSQGPPGSPQLLDFGGGFRSYCQKEKKIRICSNTGIGTQFVCKDVTMISLSLCDY